MGENSSIAHRYNLGLRCNVIYDITNMAAYSIKNKQLFTYTCWQCDPTMACSASTFTYLQVTTGRSIGIYYQLNKNKS